MGSGNTGILKGARGLAVQQQPVPAKGAVLLSVEGELDHHTFEILNEAIRDVVDGGCFRLILDLSQVRYVSSSAMGVLVGTLAEVRAGQGGLVLLRPHPAVQEMLDTLGLAGEIPVAGDLEAALCVFPDSTEACPSP
ncbi:MAG: STAS domain-containing protein [Planctomycetota bacterium]|nr:STAS domain-containing protein [Planctomycetota bacterium]